MGNVLVNEESLQAIANAIREKNGTEETYKPSQMADAVRAIQSGGSDDGSPVVKNMTTNEVYGNIQKAMNEATENDTISLLGDLSVLSVHVPNNITFDLNGFTLTAEFFACHGDIVDMSDEKTGLLVAEKDHILLQKNNKQLPIKTTQGYGFYVVTKIAFKLQDNKYSQKVYVENLGNALLTQGVEVSGVFAGVYLSNELATQLTRFTDSVMKSYFGGYNPATDKYSYALTYTFTNVTSVTTINGCIVSELGVEFKSDDSVYTPA